LRPNFGKVFPALQASFAILVFILNRAPRFLVVSGHETFDVPPKLPAGVQCLMALDLPAMPILAPFYIRVGGLLDGQLHWPANRWLAATFGLAGIFIWLCAGRALDDVINKFRRPHAEPERHPWDGPFLGLILACAGWVFVESDLASFVFQLDESIVRLISGCWLIFGCAVLTMHAVLRRRARLNSASV
jgi:hypothetical protein